MERVYQLGLDIDKPTPDPLATMAKVHEGLGGVEVFVYSTASSTMGAYKVRALIPYNEPVSPDDHRASWLLVARALAKAGVVVDAACKDPARGFFVWAIPANGAYVHGHTDGEPWNAKSAAEGQRRYERLEAQMLGRGPASAPTSSRYSSPEQMVRRARAYVDRMEPSVAGAGGHDACWAVARKLIQDFQLSPPDAWTVLVEFNARCQPPWSERELRHKFEQASLARVVSPVPDRERTR